MSARTVLAVIAATLAITAGLHLTALVVAVLAVTIAFGWLAIAGSWARFPHMAVRTES